MAQPTYKPLKLTLIPPAPVTQPVPQPMPNFAYIPNNIQPIVAMPQPIDRVGQMTEEDLREKERRRLEGNKIRSARYVQKTSEYKKLGTMKTEKEKITALTLLCYPELRNMDPSILDSKVSQYIASLQN